ncbi:hypothetical protein DPMN_050813 [Dreissena polymorpha]|uniref:Uncharacterized protein n=1 Tax=Dreissena polymorpha TaxID=45954 RepID=A0A9D4CIL8_DREPO|nr:hypothetical protein DPMN_050813 [Dreissena polymorpha]
MLRFTMKTGFNNMNHLFTKLKTVLPTRHVHRRHIEAEKITIRGKPHGSLKNPTRTATFAQRADVSIRANDKKKRESVEVCLQELEFVISKDEKDSPMSV